MNERQTYRMVVAACDLIDAVIDGDRAQRDAILEGFGPKNLALCTSLAFTHLCDSYGLDRKEAVRKVRAAFADVGDTRAAQ